MSNFETMEMENEIVVANDDNEETDIVVYDETDEEDDGPSAAGIAVLAVGAVAGVAAGVKFCTETLPRLKALGQYKKEAKKYMRSTEVIEKNKAGQWIVYDIVGGPIRTLSEYIAFHHSEDERKEEEAKKDEKEKETKKDEVNEAKPDKKG